MWIGRRQISSRLFPTGRGHSPTPYLVSTSNHWIHPYWILRLLIFIFSFLLPTLFVICVFAKGKLAFPFHCHLWITFLPSRQKSACRKTQNEVESKYLGRTIYLLFGSSSGFWTAWIRGRHSRQILIPFNRCAPPPSPKCLLHLTHLSDQHGLDSDPWLLIAYGA